MSSRASGMSSRAWRYYALSSMSVSMFARCYIFCELTERGKPTLFAWGKRCPWTEVKLSGQRTVALPSPTFWDIQELFRKGCPPSRKALRASRRTSASVWVDGCDHLIFWLGEVGRDLQPNAVRGGEKIEQKLSEFARLVWNARCFMPPRLDCRSSSRPSLSRLNYRAYYYINYI